MARSGLDRLTLAEAAAIIDAAVKDKSYRVSPLGQLVGRYMRWFRNEWGATPETLRDYEAVLAKMSLRLAHRNPLEVDVEDLRAVIDYFWSDASARTRQKVTSVIRSFWGWAEDEALVPFSPAARLRRPRAPRKVAPLLPQDARPRLLSVAKHPRDRLRCSAFYSSACGAASLAGSVSATSTYSAASFGSTGRARRNGCSLCGPYRRGARSLSGERSSSRRTAARA